MKAGSKENSQPMFETDYTKLNATFSFTPKMMYYKSLITEPS